MEGSWVQKMISEDNILFAKRKNSKSRYIDLYLNNQVEFEGLIKVNKNPEKYFSTLKLLNPLEIGQFDLLDDLKYISLIFN